MLMIPKRIRPGELPVDKPVRRVPDSKFRGPANRPPSPTVPVPDQGARLPLFRSLDQAVIKPGRRDCLQILWSREERKDFLNRPRQPLFPFQIVEQHIPLWSRLHSFTAYGTSEGLTYASNSGKRERTMSQWKVKAPALLLLSGLVCIMLLIVVLPDVD